MKNQFAPSKYQLGVQEFCLTKSGNGIVIAVAGSGKSSTLEWLYPQLRGFILQLAFNKPIQLDLEARVKEAKLTNVTVKTFNGCGFGGMWKDLPKAGKRLLTKLDKDKMKCLVMDRLDRIDFEEFGSELIKLCGLAKAYGIVPEGGGGIGLYPDTDQIWHKLVDLYDLDIRVEIRPYVYRILRELLIKSIAVVPEVIDFDDQKYIPVIKQLPIRKYDWVLVDEAQDASHIDRALIKMCLREGGRMIAVGDPCQSIYGFRGAAADSMDLIADEFKTTELPLTISYRCPKAVVFYAQSIVSHIEASPTAKVGTVVSIPRYTAKEFRPDDLAICRNTAPLVTMAYRVLGQGVACRIIGRDISGGLVRLIEKLKPKGLRGEHGLVEKLIEWRDAEIESLVERGKESKVEGILDKYDTLMTFIEESGVETVPALKEKITGMFNDDKGTDVLTFCTIHRAKGLEANRVFILNPDLMPSPYAKQEWQVTQEHNLMYVAYTRAKDTLAFINSTDIVREHHTPVGLRAYTLPDYPRIAA